MRIISILFFLIITGVNASGQAAAKWVLTNPHLSRIDAAYPFSDDYVALISGRSILYLPVVDGPDFQPMTATLPGSLFPAEYNSKPITAALSFDKSTVLLFKGNVYIALDKTTFTPKGELSTWTGWPGMWNNSIDAALNWPDGSFIFIKGLQYVSYDPRSGRTSDPAQLNRLPGWPSNWSDGIDDAFNGGDGFLYFLRKGQILAMSANSKKFAPGYPRSLAAGNGGSIMVMGGASLPDNNETNNKPGYNNQGNPVDNTGEWCAVGTPDASKTAANGSITPGTSPYAGGPGGKEFRDVLPAGTRVSEIRVWGSWNITAIEIVTESREGFITESGKHGSVLGAPKVFKMVPGECITGIEGTWGGTSGNYIYTLQFITNKRKSPQYGGIGGMKGVNPFTALVPPEASFAGFAGKASDNLDAIGIQYYIIQYLFVDASGKIIEATGDKKNWASGQEDPKKAELEKNGGKKDPYNDDLKDISDLSAEDKRNLLGEMWNYKIMPNVEWVGHAVDFCKVDPFDITSSVGLPQMSPLFITPGPNVGGPKNDWFTVNGANKQRSTSITTGRSTEKIQILNSYNSYSREFAIAVGGEFDAPGTAAGSLNYGHTERKTETIGRERVMVSKTVERKSHSLSFDLSWANPKSGEKFRQILNQDFRKDVGELPLPPGSITAFPTSQMRKGVELPSNLSRYRKQYQALIDKWGTHYMNDIVFGGYYTMWMMMTREEIQKSKMTLDSLGAKFSATISGVKVGASAKGQYETTTASGSSKTNSEIQIIATGGGGNTEFSQWSQDVTNEPRPQSYRLYSHATLLTPVFFPFDEDIQKKQKTLDIMIRQYLVDNNKAPGHDWNEALPFLTNEQKEEQSGAEGIKLKVEFLRMKIETEDGDGEGSSQELFGKLQFAVVGKNDVQKKAGTFWEVGGSGTEFNKSSWKNFSGQVYEISVTKSEKDNLKLMVYGWLKDYDTYSANDDICNYRSVNDGVETEFTVLNAPGKSEEVDIPLEGAVTIKVRLTWIK